MNPAALPPTNIKDIQNAAKRIAPFIHRTPLLTSATLNEELQASVFFKCENLQKIGAFKARGALNAVLSLSDEEAARGVVCHSSGNHGQALAYAASQRGIHCTVVIPDRAPELKINAVRGYGAEVVLCAHADRETTSLAIQTERNAVMVHPFNNRKVIAGQGTATLEMFEDIPDLDVVIAPIGGGGLMSGTSIATRALRPAARLIGAEPERADDAARSLASGKLLAGVPNPDTIADGLLTGLAPLTFSIMVTTGVEVVTVSEESIVDAGRFHLFRMKMLVEPSGATSLAAIRLIRDQVKGLKIGAIVSGGNTDLSWLDR